MLNRPLFFVLCALIFAIGSATTSVRAEDKGFHAGGQLQWEYLFRDGNVSEVLWYDETGQLVSKEIYLAGRSEKTQGYRTDGSLEWQTRSLGDNRQEITLYDVVGQTTARYQTLEGQPDGEYLTFYSDGRPKQIVTYRQGVLDGPARTFYNSGQTKHEFSYKNDEVEGLYRVYSPEGRQLSEYLFSAGKLQ